MKQLTIGFIALVILGTAGFIALVILGTAAYLSFGGVVKPLGGGFSVDNAFYLTPGSATDRQAGDPFATSTVLFLETTDTATSSITGFSGAASNIDLFLGMTASTSATTKLQYFVSFSPNKIDWYKEDCSSIDSTVLVTHGASACVHAWTVTGSGVQTKNITIGATQSKYFKIDFGVTGANGSLWAVAVPKEDTPN